METNFRNFPNEQTNAPDFKREYKTPEIEDTIIQVFINARKFYDLTQKQLLEKSGITNTWQ